MGFDLIVIMGVIAVITGGLKNWGEINGINSQILEIIQLFNNAPQVATFVALQPWHFFPGFPGYCSQEFMMGLLAVGKAIGKDLVKNRIFDPIRGANFHAFPRQCFTVRVAAS